MTTAIVTTAAPRIATANTVLGAVTIAWFATALIGQWAFMYYIFAFYGPSTFTGHFAAWTRNTNLLKGYVPGDTAGNLAFAAHALLAGIIAFGGALQLIPRLRSYAPSFHRWNGRVFLVTALGLSLSGLYMVWVRGASTGLVGSFAISLNAALIVTFCALAWRAAVARNISVHRRWALRLYLVANAQWFTRVGFLAWALINRLLIGAKWLNAPFFEFWGFGCYLVPLAVLELYLRTKNSDDPRAHFAMAGGLAVLTLLMAFGIAGVAALMWWPLIARS